MPETFLAAEERALQTTYKDSKTWSRRGGQCRLNRGAMWEMVFAETGAQKPWIHCVLSNRETDYEPRRVKLFERRNLVWLFLAK